MAYKLSRTPERAKVFWAIKSHNYGGRVFEKIKRNDESKKQDINTKDDFQMVM